jgi:predicted DNA-binding protein (MmcQ/YjbR family)
MTAPEPVPPVTNDFERPVFARARQLCLAFPETNEQWSWNHPTFRAGRKAFCAFELLKGRPSIAFRLAPADSEPALQRKHFFATPYGRGLWVSAWVDGAIDWKLIASLVRRSYRTVANKRLLKALDAGPAPRRHRLIDGDKRKRREN